MATWIVFLIGFAIGMFCGGLLTLYTAYVLTSVPQDVHRWRIIDPDEPH